MPQLLTAQVGLCSPSWLCSTLLKLPPPAQMARLLSIAGYTEAIATAEGIVLQCRFNWRRPFLHGTQIVTGRITSEQAIVKFLTHNFLLSLLERLLFCPKAATGGVHIRTYAPYASTPHTRVSWIARRCKN